jgi:hypothetical protein
VDVQIVLRVAILPPGGLDQRGHSAAQMPGLAFIPATTVSSGAILFRSSHKRGRRILAALRGAPPPIVRACSVVYRYCRISFRLQLPPDDAVVR